MLTIHFSKISLIKDTYEKLASLLLVLIVPLLATGPFLPDLFLSVFVLIYFFILFKKKVFYLEVNKFFNFYLLYCLYLIILSLLSVNILLSLEQSLFYFRFGFFLIFAIYIFKKYEFVENIFFNLIFLTSLIVSLDAIFQFIYGFNILGFYKIDDFGYFGRISGVFGDESILGSYLSKILPIMFYAVNTQKNHNKNFKYFILILAFITIVISGERTATFFALLFIFGFIIFNTHYKIHKKILFLSTTILLLILTISFNDNLKKRFVDITLSQFFDKNKKLLILTEVHTDQFETGYNIFKDNPFFGVGTKLYRHYGCKNPKYISEYSCTTHPHNTYIQILSETGVIGTIPIVLLFIFSIYKLFFSKGYKNRNQKICACLSMICFLWPLMPTGNFFNNWLSILLFSNLIFFYKVIIKKDD